MTDMTICHLPVRRSLRTTRSSSLAFVVAASAVFVVMEVLTASPAIALQPLPRPVPRSPYLTVVASVRTTIATDSVRARHVSPSVSQWNVRVDSAVGGVLFARAPFEVNSRYRTDGLVRVPIERERAASVLVTPVASRLRTTPGFERGSAVMPLAEAERAAQQELMLTFARFASVFDGVPDGVGTTHIADSADGLLLRLDATHRLRVLRDTVVNGRNARVVRDSTSLMYRRRTRIPSRFTVSMLSLADSMRGSIVGVRVVDAESRHTISVHDTVRLRGRRLADDGYGGAAELPAWEYSVREVSVRDSLSPPIAREPFDMVNLDRSRRALTAAQFDSALSRLRAEPDIVVRDSIRRRFRFLGDPRWLPRMMAASLAVGDTGAAADALTMDPYSRPGERITAEHYRWLRELLRSGAAAERVGFDRELAVINLTDALVHAPPVLSSTADGGPICTSDGCEAMSRDAKAPVTATALRAVGLVAAMVTEPRAWTDSVIANAASNVLLSGSSLRFARGVASGAAASAKAPIPIPTAPESAWRYWLMGEDSAYARERAAAQSAIPAGARPNISFSRRLSQAANDDAGRALRFAQVRTGTSYASAFRQQLNAATNDSTRALYTALLMAMDDSVFTTNDLVQLVLGSPSEQRDLAVAQITGYQLRTADRSGPPPSAPDSIAAAIGLRVIESLFGNTPLTFVGGANTRRGFFQAPPAVDSVPQFLSMDSLPAAVRERAAALGHAPTAVGWAFTSGSTGLTTHIGPVRQSGPFFSIDVTYTTLYARAVGRSGGYASGFTLWLVQGPQGWVVFNAASWIT